MNILDDDLDIDLGECVFELQESIFPEHKWNRAVYTLEKNGHFGMEFEWDQALQDKWEKSIKPSVRIKLKIRKQNK